MEMGPERPEAAAQAVREGCKGKAKAVAAGKPFPHPIEHLASISQYAEIA